MESIVEAAAETPFMAQRRKLRALKDRQETGELVTTDKHIHPKAQKRRDAEAAAKPVASKKVSKKKSKTTSD